MVQDIIWSAVTHPIYSEQMEGDPAKMTLK